MKRSLAVLSIVSVIALASFTGCATCAKGSSDEEEILAVLATWEAGMIEPNVEKMASAFSEDFSNDEVADKAKLIEFIEGAIDMGYLEDGEIYKDDMEIKLEGDTATAYPIDFSTNAGEVTIELTFTKEEGGWMITGMDIEGM